MLFFSSFKSGIPLFYLELAIGQRIRKAAISCWNLVSPFAAGIGIASAIVSFNIGLYYNTVVAWCIYYLWSSLKSPLPFTHCPSKGNSSVGEKVSALNQFTMRPPSTNQDYVTECQVSRASLCFLKSVTDKHRAGEKIICESPTSGDKLRKKLVV